MNRILTSLPVWIVLADMLYGFTLNVLQSLNLYQAKLPKSSLPIAPDTAFSGLQVLANGGMIAIIGFGLLVLLQLNRTVQSGQILPIGVFRTLGLVAVLAFSVPSLWEWFWAFAGLAGGRGTVGFGDLRYLAVAACLPLTACLCVYRLFGWYRLHGRLTPEA